MEKEFKRILSNKSILINIAYYGLIDTEENSWEKLPDGSKRRSGDKIPLNALAFYGESFIFELSSFLDILMKFICGLRIDDDLHFNKNNLLKITPQDDFIKFLIECWDKGITNSDIYNLKKMKEYRNAITHATFLDIHRLFHWRAGQPFPTFENNAYFIPDNPETEFDKFTYNNNLTLFGFIKAISNIFEEIIKKINSANYYNKYKYNK